VQLGCLWVLVPSAAVDFPRQSGFHPPMRPLVLFAAMLGLSARAVEPLVPLETFFGLPTIREPELSPDGTHLVPTR
jgi:hypothetical protein